MSGETDKLLKPKRSLVVLSAFVAMMLPLVPAALTLRSAWLVPYLALGAIARIILSVRKFRVPSPTRATVPEFFFATVSAAFVPSLLAVSWLVTYLATFWAVRLANLAGGLHGDQRSIAMALSLTLLAVFGVSTARYITGDLGAALYPQWGGSRTKFFYLTRQPRATVNVGASVILVSVAITGAVFVSSSWLSPTVGFVCLMCVLAVAAAAQPVPSPVSPTDARTGDIQAIGEALAELGYRVVSYPRTGQREAEPFARQLELFCYSGDRAYAVEVKRGGPEEEPLTWTTAAQVLTAAQALERAELIETGARIQPLLVLLDAQTDESLAAFCQGEGVSLVDVHASDASMTIIGQNKSELEAIGRRCLGTPLPAHSSKLKPAGSPATGVTAD